MALGKLGWDGQRNVSHIGTVLATNGQGREKR